MYSCTVAKATGPNISTTVCLQGQAMRATLARTCQQRSQVARQSTFSTSSHHSVAAADNSEFALKSRSRSSLNHRDASGERLDTFRRRKFSTSSISQDYSREYHSVSHYVPRLEQTLAPRRQALTAREHRALDDMFASVLNATKMQEVLLDQEPRDTPSPLAPLAQKLSTKPLAVHWTRPGDDILDFKKEEIELCENDQALYQWATNELFGSLSTAVDAASGQIVTTNASLPEKLPSFAYPQLLSLVMQAFRTKYRNPHTALALFEHARNASATSYVTFCGTAAYNELIEIKWECFKDLLGVCESLEEMRLNKVRLDTKTTRIADNVRREVGDHTFWREEGFSESHASVAKIIERIEAACWPPSTSSEQSKRPLKSHAKRKWSPDTDAWKGATNKDQDRLDFV